MEMGMGTGEGGAEVQIVGDHRLRVIDVDKKEVPVEAK